MTATATALGRRIRALIEATGPMSIADYMAMALGDPAEGYYTTREPFGVAGDFVTAPEISQMFGELIGVWCLAAHEAIGAPAALNLVEIGPGRGTLMADLLRATRIRPAFAAAAAVHLIETSPRLRKVQAETLRGAGSPIWHQRFGTVPDGPLIVVANEVFDALPIQQFVRAARGWRERLVGLGADDGLAFGVGAAMADPSLLPPEADAQPIGTVFELGRPGAALMAEIAERIARFGGALLIVDYGHTATSFGSTLQAVSRHGRADPLDRPGAIDLTTHVDFAALAAVARQAGAVVHGPVEQGAFLLALGLLERAGALGQHADAAGRAALAAAVERLASPKAMGRLFKAMAVSSQAVPLPGFPAPRPHIDPAEARSDGPTHAMRAP